MRSPQALRALKKRVKTLEKVLFEYAKTTTEANTKAFSSLANNCELISQALIKLKNDQDILFKCFGLITEYLQHQKINEQLNEKIKNFA
jgi:hypothetical protein